MVGASQIGFGALLLAAPERIAQPFGVRMDEPRARWFARLYGIRDVGTGLGLWHAARAGTEHRPWLAMEALIQAVDAGATAVAWRRGHLSTRAAVPVLAIAPAWVVLCVLGMLDSNDDVADDGVHEDVSL